MSAPLAAALAALPPEALILDAGGWFKPLPRATHVADLMPYETRRGVLTPRPQPGECFARATWTQADFLRPDLRLPYPDAFFDFSVCGHTVEDLADPSPLLRELRRVSRAGYIECPSRLSEQTVGQRDRMGRKQGHPHHHWIMEPEARAGLRLYHKDDSLRDNPASRIPLRSAEHRIQESPGSDVSQVLWTTTFDFECIRGPAARARAVEFAASLGISSFDRVIDGWERAARRWRAAAMPADRTDTRAWWREMVTMSEPYSSLPLR